MDEHVVDHPGGHPLQPARTAGSTGRRACRSPSGTAGCRPSAPSRARPGRRGSSSLSRGARAIRSSSEGRLAAPRSAPAGRPSCRPTRPPAARVSEAGMSTTIALAVAVRRDGAAPPLASGAPPPAGSRCGAGHSLDTTGTSPSAHASSRSRGQVLTIRSGVDAGRLGPLAAVVEHVELAGRVGVGVDGEQAAECRGPARAAGSAGRDARGGS